jgi:hypothetical protein
MKVDFYFSDYCYVDTYNIFPLSNMSDHWLHWLKGSILLFVVIANLLSAACSERTRTQTESTCKKKIDT